MRYAIFTDIHANLEALEAVLAKIDELSQQEPIDEIWFLGDLVGYGPNPNECIAKLRERTDVIIAGNHDWAAVGKLDLEDFSEAARISAEWTATQLTEENQAFLANLPERIEKGECILVHGSPHGPLWEYLTSEVLAERSFQCFTNRYCFVGHTHVPVIFQQPDTVANTPTRPLEVEAILNETDIATSQDADEMTASAEVDKQLLTESQDDETTTTGEIVSLHSSQSETPNGAFTETEQIQDLVANAADAIADLQHQIADDAPETQTDAPDELKDIIREQTAGESATEDAAVATQDDETKTEIVEDITPEETIQNAEERLNQEIEELLSLLGLSQSMIEVTNEMCIPPEGPWQAPEGYRAIVNPGGVGQPRDGDPRAAFMIYDTQKGFHFYRIPYSFEKTQEKIVKVKLPQYLATRLAYGR
ncbi:metallophosphoesterase family protein [Dictyobacter arantiisoli]|uniref:Calcineurin-like phosphoesterase domain-containing protein n=1 Tax=Dictyobacter arantiisoli TaxID=2014874 RepID=A0A5A5T8Z5_9CHLR|nr:metallophosphoesterase family protein [Dictyobacter arantiisoli]GCF07872.1 hypothetical protein KDI_14360 [Dictyobacter arantiisoli]